MCSMLEPGFFRKAESELVARQEQEKAQLTAHKALEPPVPPPRKPERILKAPRPPHATPLIAQPAPSYSVPAPSPQHHSHQLQTVRHPPSAHRPMHVLQHRPARPPVWQAPLPPPAPRTQPSSERTVSTPRPHTVAVQAPRPPQQQHVLRPQPARTPPGPQWQPAQPAPAAEAAKAAAEPVYSLFGGNGAGNGFPGVSLDAFASKPFSSGQHVHHHFAAPALDSAGACSQRQQLPGIAAFFPSAPLQQQKPSMAEQPLRDGFAQHEAECLVCMSGPKDMCCIPCGHVCMCAACAEQVQQASNACPLCRGPIQCLLHIPR